MDFVLLGTGAGVPAKARNVTSIALQLLEERGKFGYLIVVKRRSIKF